MGKEQDLLEAARCGNISVVERILTHRAKKTGPLASLRRGPGPNVQDLSGYTPLHHAALNGHKDIVALLLNHDALSNIVNDKGCTPLHLASWSGNAEIVKVLLTHESSIPSVNHMNFDHESALHSAAQYGHTEICKLLIQHNCYPSVRNIRNESPLDLASQYGRLDTVQSLLDLHPELLNDFVHCHSPVHLASKNGHKHVVKLLLDSGFNVNFMTDVGTALHEAAMYGKVDVVRLLLEYGVNVNLENSRKRTVFDILQDLNTNIARQIEEIIKDHMLLIKLDSDSNDSVSAILPPLGFVTESQLLSLLPEKCLPNISPPRQFCSSPDNELYEIPPLPKQTNPSVSMGNDSICSLTFAQSRESSFDRASYSSCSPKCDPHESASYENSMMETAKHENHLYDIPLAPSTFPSKRFSDPLQHNVIYQNVCLPDVSSQNSYIPMMPAQAFCNSRPMPPAKPPRKSISPNIMNFKKEGSPKRKKDNYYEFLYLATSGQQSQNALVNEQDDNGTINRSSHDKSDYVDMDNADSMIPRYENHEIICANGLNVKKKTNEDMKKLKEMAFNHFSEIFPVSVNHENLHRKANSFSNLMPSKSTPALHASRHMIDHAVPPPFIDKDFRIVQPDNLNFQQKRASIQIPTSPTNYNQPPTPDIPPPSPATAETGIHEKIRPINQEYRSKKSVVRDIDTLTDEQLVATIGPSGEVQLTLATDNKCISTESNFSPENPFAGLCRGSVSVSNKPRNPHQFPTSHSDLSLHIRGFSGKCRNIYENVQIAMDNGQREINLSKERDSHSSGNNHSSLSVMSPFDEKAEWAEIADIMASFGGGITRESVFAQNMESNFTQAFRSDSSRSSSTKFENIGQWLADLGLSQYENLLVINGFDDIHFLGGNIVEDQDLEEIGIENLDHREQIFLAAQRLPVLLPISKTKGTPNFPASIDNWLHSINLQEYMENFVNNNITDIDRALKLWEVELNTVMKINKIGHRKRILASLGDKQFDRFSSSVDIDLSKLNLDLSELAVEDHDKTVDKTQPDTSDATAHRSRNYLRIRPPTQLMNESRLNQDIDNNATDTQWRHHPNDLIHNCCNYMSKYLGSTVVRELRGMESTKKSIQKLRSSSQDIMKIPNIILSISFSGVKFIDAETQQLVCEHEIRNIHCACQDADDLCHFAYITKDHQTHNHYCHVFSSSSVELASEIILTLGQAFEVAYQIAVLEKTGNNSHLWHPCYVPENNESCEITENVTRESS